MSSAEAQTAAPLRYDFEFRGSGREYFRIWIVNLALTIATLGVFSAWAKVRTQRYLYGSVFVDGHAFDYHAPPLRILFGRLIALGLLLGYEGCNLINPLYALPWLLVAGFAMPWLVNSSLRFGARYTSYRNLRFNFTGRYFEALIAYVVWPLAAASTLFALAPMARRARDYFWVNHHSYGGRFFKTDFKPWRIYLIYGLATLLFVAVVALILIGVGYGTAHLPKQITSNSTVNGVFFFSAIGALYFAFLMLGPAIETLVINLVLNRTTFDGRHKLTSRMSALVVAWITVTNALLTLATLGLFYPWARVRLMRYRMKKLSLLMEGTLDDYTGETLSQSAVGEEIGSLFAFDFGL
jgi:uncharacterized membrane protein YjgN (DUF898 family)